MATARETMSGVREALNLANRVLGMDARIGVVRSVSENENGGDVAMLGFEDMDGLAVLVGTVNPDGDTDTILKLTPEQARAFGAALRDSADEAEGIK